MIFNGYDFSQYWRVKKLDPLLPERNIVERTIPGTAGARFVRSEFEPREIDVTMRLKLPLAMADPTTVNYIKRLAAQALSSEEPAELMFYEEPDVRYQAICTYASTFDMPTFTGAVDLTFHCPDPMAYYQFERTMEVEPGENILTVAGTWELMPSFHLIAATANDIRITNADGRFVQCKGKFKAGDKVDVDFAKGFVYTNGVLSQFSLDSRFFEMPVGESAITITGIQSGDIIFRERSI